MKTFITILRNDRILLPERDLHFISQLKMHASTQLTKYWTQYWNGEMSPDVIIFLYKYLIYYFIIFSCSRNPGIYQYFRACRQAIRSMIHNHG